MWFAYLISISKAHYMITENTHRQQQQQHFWMKWSTVTRKIAAQTIHEIIRDSLGLYSKNASAIYNGIALQMFILLLDTLSYANIATKSSCVPCRFHYHHLHIYVYWRYLCIYLCHSVMFVCFFLHISLVVVFISFHLYVFLLSSIFFVLLKFSHCILYVVFLSIGLEVDFLCIENYYCYECERHEVEENLCLFFSFYLCIRIGQNVQQ